MFVQRIALDFKEVVSKIQEAVRKAKPQVVVGVARGGVVPAAIAAALAGAELGVIELSMYDESMPPKKLREEPKLIRTSKLNLKSRRVLIVDDVVRTGKSLEKAKKLCEREKPANISTLVLGAESKESADYVLYETKACVVLPWNAKACRRK